MGCGSYTYVKNSVLVDFSEEMLKKAKGKKKINLNLNKGKLPFPDNSFDSITMIFIINYLKNIDKLFKEIKRVLKNKGKLIIVNSKKTIDEFYRKQEIKHYNKKDLKNILREFKIDIKEKTVENRNLVFVEAK